MPLENARKAFTTALYLNPKNNHGHWKIKLAMHNLCQYDLSLITYKIYGLGKLNIILYSFKMCLIIMQNMTTLKRIMSLDFLIFICFIRIIVCVCFKRNGNTPLLNSIPIKLLHTSPVWVKVAVKSAKNRAEIARARKTMGLPPDNPRLLDHLRRPIVRVLTRDAGQHPCS
ncbi:UDP-N-acetylglucosamine--peptide N-acetylglucosaminyltransferase 110 kDa subunit-like isoform X2 [Aphis craccivora]|uniref:UDP-N-acetylglucosamine--peptide N-acetylglucosaminyltransferase 110 kDa subunit-like isoform X2 n=1 Tax=Aphis craccivora TaxID=307492 RepID=A0A6G0Y1T4_APHCR|nr:UDP-N-acetylglucosamine--peptide N-acetylglucosaminyltransferase 110 kDa subunit-like isoform X2 [Aphis craccivora]